MYELRRSPAWPSGLLFGRFIGGTYYVAGVTFGHLIWVIEKRASRCPGVERRAVRAIREFYDVRERRLVGNAGFNARSERFLFDWTQNA